MSQEPELTPDDQLAHPCKCGSGQTAGECCASNASCKCGSGKSARECCFAERLDDDDTDD